MNKRSLYSCKEALMKNGERGENLVTYIEQLEIKNEEFNKENKRLKFKVVMLEAQLTKNYKSSADSEIHNSTKDEIIKDLKQEVFNLRQELTYYREKIKKMVV